MGDPRYEQLIYLLPLLVLWFLGYLAFRNPLFRIVRQFALWAVVIAALALAFHFFSG